MIEKLTRWVLRAALREIREVDPADDCLCVAVNVSARSIGDLLDNMAHAAIVRSIIELGHNLSLRVVGEGIETDRTLAWLDQAGCDVAQGFLLARPMPIAELTIWMRRHARGSLAPATRGE